MAPPSALRDAVSARPAQPRTAASGLPNVHALPEISTMPEFSVSRFGYWLDTHGGLHAERTKPEPPGNWANGESAAVSGYWGSENSSGPPRPGANNGLPRERIGRSALPKARAIPAAGGQAGPRRFPPDRRPVSGKVAATDQGTLPSWSLRKPKNHRFSRPPIHPVFARRTPRPVRPRRFKPILLSKMLGLGAIRPPPDGLVAPEFAPAPGNIPKTGPDGTALSGRRPDAAELELVVPPEAPGRCARKPHWHSGEGEFRLHEGPVWGVWSRGRWSWLTRLDGRWWIEVPPEAAPGDRPPPLVRHRDRWWWRAEGRWFLLHQGQPWAYRNFDGPRSEGFFQPGSGAQMIYSADGARVALVIPGEGAVLFDAGTGAELARWREEEMPKPRRPRAPTRLSFEPAK